MVAISAPGFIAKQCINIAQMGAAVKVLILFDRQRDEREHAAGRGKAER